MKWYPLLLFALFACNSDQDSNPAHFENQSDSTLLIENDDDDEEWEQLKVINHVTDTAYNYHFVGVDLCGHNSGTGPTHFLDYDTLQKYDRDHKYHKKLETIGDSIFYTFEVIADCCYMPAPSVQITSDSINISYALWGSYPCDCLCDYSFSYAFPLEIYKEHWIEEP